MHPRTHAVIVIGAGPAGLATSHELGRRDIEHVVLERGARVGYAWANLYDSLTLHTGKHMSALPGMPFPTSTPLFPPRQHFLEYLERYAATFHLPIRTGCEAQSVRRDNGAWKVRTRQGEWQADVLVIATGILSNPHLPDFPGRERFRGRVLHSVEYLRPQPFAGRNVLVVGVGNSSGEISTELTRAGARVTIAVRSGAIALPRQLFGVPIQYFSCLTSRLPRRLQKALITITGKVTELRRGPPVLPRPTHSDCPDVPLIGLHLVDAIRDGAIRVKGAITAFTETGLRFADGTEEAFDDVILATGYKAAIGLLGSLIRPDHCGFAQRQRRVVSVDQDNLYFVGHNYDSRGGLFNIAMDSKQVAQTIARGFHGK